MRCKIFRNSKHLVVKYIRRNKLRSVIWSLHNRGRNVYYLTKYLPKLTKRGKNIYCLTKYLPKVTKRLKYTLFPLGGYG